MPTGPCPANWTGQLWFPVDASRPELGGVEIRYTIKHDGTSTRETGGCMGTVTDLGARSSATVTMYAHFEGRKGTPRTITIEPGFDNLANPYTKGQLNSQGFSDSTDVEGLVINTTPGA